MPKKKNWSVYILRCADDTLYTGISNNVEKRIAAHNSGKGARYIIPARRPAALDYVEEGFDVGGALKREHAIKKSGRAAKEKLIAACGKKGKNGGQGFRGKKKGL
ncbi:MAG: GIY-YIG nuclease family protein [Candidatus Goldiibacteriota bacterium]